MGLKQRARMSENLIRRGLDPFKVVMRKLVCSFRTRIIQSNNVLLETRSTQRAQTSLAEADHYSHIAHCKNVEPWL